MSLVFIFLTALVVGYSGAVVPGPMFTLVVAESMERGAKAGPIVMAGHAVLELALLGGLAVGLTQVLSLPLVTACISVVGGAVMLWMGGTLLARAVRGGGVVLAGDRLEVDRTLARRSTLRLMGLGAVVSFSNPYWSLWWVTVGSAYLVSAALYGIFGIAAFFFGHVLADLTWFSLVAYVVAYGRRFLTQAIYRRLIAVCGVALIGLATYFVVRGARGL
jgi:threonine/homoserine/homoserine lactone efflux protein